MQIINTKDKRIIITLAVLFLTIIIAAIIVKMVFYRGSAYETVDNKKEIIKTDLEVILEAFSNDDKQKLSDLFSEMSRSDNDLDTQIDEAFDFFKGNIVSHQENSTPVENTSTKKGQIIRSDISNSSTIKTDTGNEYRLTFSDRIVYNGSNNNKETGIMYITLRDEKENVIYIGDLY